MRIITPIILLILSVSLYFWFIDKKIDQLKDLRAEASSYSEVLDKTKELDDIRKKKLEAINNIGEKNLALLEKILPNNIDTIRLIINLNGIAKRHGLSINAVSLEGAGDSNNASLPYGVMSFGFSVKSSYEAFLNLLKDLERSLALIDVKSISLKPGVKDDDYSFSIKAQTYWLK